ncbi:MAG: hypothetical protein ACK4VM_00280 [Bosea sp. (in: a-proteobacteria)]
MSAEFRKGVANFVCCRIVLDIDRDLDRPRQLGVGPFTRARRGSIVVGPASLLACAIGSPHGRDEDKAAIDAVS